MSLFGLFTRQAGSPVHMRDGGTVRDDPAHESCCVEFAKGLRRAAKAEVRALQAERERDAMREQRDEAQALHVHPVSKLIRERHEALALTRELLGLARKQRVAWDEWCQTEYTGEWTRAQTHYREALDELGATANRVEAELGGDADACQQRRLERKPHVAGGRSAGKNEQGRADIASSSPLAAPSSEPPYPYIATGNADWGTGTTSEPPLERRCDNCRLGRHEKCWPEVCSCPCSNKEPVMMHAEFLRYPHLLACPSVPLDPDDETCSRCGRVRHG